MADTPDRPDDPLHEYFDRLDAAFATLNDHAAFATLNAPPPARPPEPSTEAISSNDRPGVPRLDAVAHAPGSHVTAQVPNLIAEAFAALLALEEGEPGARPVRLTSTDGELRITDALVDDLTRRILERLAPDAVRAVVVDVVSEMVSEVAERLVREEIDRIRNKPHV